MRTNNQPEHVWHYTTGEKFIKIVESGILLPASIGVEPPEKPVLWFSKHHFFEPTARKAWLEGGKLRLLSVHELYERGGGLVRFGMQPEALLHGNALRAAAMMSLKNWNGLERIARAQGSTNKNWWGSIQAMPISSMVIDVMNDDWVWERVQEQTDISFLEYRAS